MALRVLIVDDNKSFLSAARDLLEGEGATVVAVVSSGADAVRRAEELRPDVTLVDIDLGDESGFDVARQLARPPGGEPSPVILISAYAEQDFIDLINASPAVGFLSKSSLTAKAVSDLLRTAGAQGSGH
jgi:CheY-like chemotaxis protein